MLASVNRRLPRAVAAASAAVPLNSSVLSCMSVSSNAFSASFFLPASSQIISWLSSPLSTSSFLVLEGQKKSSFYSALNTCLSAKKVLVAPHLSSPLPPLCATNSRLSRFGFSPPSARTFASVATSPPTNRLFRTTRTYPPSDISNVADLFLNLPPMSDITIQKKSGKQQHCGANYTTTSSDAYVMSMASLTAAAAGAAYWYLYDCSTCSPWTSSSKVDNEELASSPDVSSSSNLFSHFSSLGRNRFFSFFSSFSSPSFHYFDHDHKNNVSSSSPPINIEPDTFPFQSLLLFCQKTWEIISNRHTRNSSTVICCEEKRPSFPSGGGGAHTEGGFSSSNNSSSNSISSGHHSSMHLPHPMWRSEQNKPFERKMADALLFCGNSNKPLGQAVADRLGTKLGKVSVKRFADGEVSMQFLDSLRGKDVYIIQPTSPPVNEHLMELLLMISTCRRSSAKKITAVIPYYGYARQDRKLSSRVPISAADVARMIEAMGVDRVVAVDLHCGQIQGFFGPRVPVDNLEAQIIGLDYFAGKVLNKPVIVSPDAGGVYRARKFQEGLITRGYEECGIAMLIKQRARANEIERMDLVGSVAGSDVVIVDDMIDTAGTLCEAARELKKHGARRVFCFATHGLFSGPAIDRIEKSPLEEVIVTDTLKVREEVAKCSKIHTLSIAVLVADTIRRIHQKESLHDLFAFRSS